MKRRLVRALLLALSAVSVSLTMLAATADAAPGYFVTFVARACPSYSDIYANSDGSDSAESLQPLGPMTHYGSSGALVSPTYEQTGPQLKCKPLVDWAFTLGRGYRSGGVSGPWGSISRVTDPYPTAIHTRRSTPLLNGAVTIKLTGAQASAAAENRLWVQGGLPADPVLAGRFGTQSAPSYGFGTLRCATDDLTGDNVAYLFFPSGISHLFCYAYYVVSPPRSGTIVIRDRVEGDPVGADPAFAFSGNVSSSPGGFTLKRGQRIAFHHGAGATWKVTESAVAHYRLKSVDCTSTTGASTVSTLSTGDLTASVALAAGDTVNCTFVNRWVPTVGDLTIFNTTFGGVGSFRFIVEPYNDDPTLVSASSSRIGVPVQALPERNLALLATKPYFIEELRPADRAGRWTLVSAECDGTPRKVRDMPLGSVKEIALRIVFGKDTVCRFVNRFTPDGSIRLSDVTEGGTGPAAFVVQSLGATPRQYRQLAITDRAGAPAAAAPETPADSTRHVYEGTYLISEQPPLNAPVGSGSNLSAVNCNGHRTPVTAGSVRVTLTRSAPDLVCKFVNTLQRP